MKILDRGHAYALRMLDSPRECLLRFVKRAGEGYPGNVGFYPGTNLQEVLRACIDRVKYLDSQIPDPTNLVLVDHLRSSLKLLEMRAARRHNRDIPVFRYAIEDMPVCSKCGHIGCEGQCHE